MFCSNCGKQIKDDVKFCRYCGYIILDENREKSIANAECENKQLNTVFNRDVLNNYLYNIRTLEFYCSKLSDRKCDLECKISKLGIRTIGDGGIGSPEISDIDLGLGGAAIALIAGLILWWLKKTWVGDFFEIEGFLGGLSVLLIFASICLVIGSVIYLIVDYKRREAKYNETLVNDKNRVQAELIEKCNLSKQLNQLEDELNRTEDLRTEAYSLNIIPSKFRNIYASYFLYDFISTSAVSLNEALLHCDLDIIQQQLEKVIQQQSEIIMELARANAFNERIVSQNEQMLNHAIQTENNTALAAQYAKVSAVNSSITACIQLSEYLSM